MKIFNSCSASGGGVGLKIIDAIDDLEFNYKGFYSVYNFLVDGVVNQSLFLINNAEWLDIPIYNNKVAFKETPLDNNASAYSVSLSLFIAGNEVDNVNGFEALNGKLFLLDYTDNNNNRRLVGFSDEPMKLSIDFNVPDSHTGVSGHSLVFTGIVSKRAPKYDI